jgi:hypothetical protein
LHEMHVQTWESGGVIPVLPSYNPPGLMLGRFIRFYIESISSLNY